MLDTSDDTTVATLHARGQRLTPQRLFVLDAVRAEGGHFTADEVLARVRERYPYVNQATIYRALAWLRDQGLVSETDLGRGQAEYEYLAGPRHHHLVCLHCGYQEEFPNALLESLAATLREQYGFAPKLDHLAVFGECRVCQEASAQAGGQDHGDPA